MRLHRALCALLILALLPVGALWLVHAGHLWFAFPDRSRYPTRGIDVSHHQGPVDWSRVAGDDVGFAYVKATEGGDWTDSQFAENWDGAASAGIPRGAYHFFTLCTPGAAQADHFVDTVPVAPAALPPAIDLEFGGNCSARPPAERLVAEIEVMRDRLRARYGVEPVLYVTRDFHDAYLAGRIEGLLWVRSLFGEPSGAWALWQYRNRGRVAGITGPVDLNVARAGWLER